VGKSKHPPRYDLPNAAPEPLRFVQLFLNTADHETGRELLETPRALADWFRANDVDVGSAGSADLRRAHKLREDLRQMIASGDNAPSLEDAARRAKLQLTFTPPRLVPTAAGVDGALGRIAAAVYEARPKLGAAQDLPQLRLGLLGRVEEPFRRLVLDAALRQPTEGPPLPEPKDFDPR